MDGGMMQVDLRALDVGDSFGGPLPGRADALAGLGPLVDPGPGRWHALTVTPTARAKIEVEDWLARNGIYAFHPVLRISRRRGGRPVTVPRCYLPGYVFAKFEGAPRIHAVCAHPDVRGAIARADGTWGVLDHRDLRAIRAMADHARAALLATHAARKRRMAAAAPRPGGQALFRAGPLAGQTAQVVELRAGGSAVVRLRLFGAEMLATARTHDLVGLHGGLDS